MAEQTPQPQPAAPPSPAPQGQGQGGRPPAAAQAPADPRYAWPATRTVLGTPVKRFDGPDKVTGRARYTFDINRPGMLYARIVRSPHPHARVAAIDLAPARRAPGVRAALGPSRTRPRAEQPRDVPGRRGRGRGRRHRRAGHRRRAPREGRLRGAAAPDQRGCGADRSGAAGVHERQRATGADAGIRRSCGGLCGCGAHARADLRNPRHHARVSRVARHRVRVGGRQAHRLDLDAGHQRRPRELRDRAEHPAGQHPRDLPVHGRRLRQQGAEHRRRGPVVREAGPRDRQAGQADARSQGGAPGRPATVPRRRRGSRPACRPMA